ncbi:hypothetical protein ACJMK2_042905 [Sinanodonta woodiana]|uniref:Ig-like domain-containing protein n=1 Tax=Sinanodonta woodiana TaxID=1069815 RepID=A0ABD3VYH4_SINWO
MRPSLFSAISISGKNFVDKGNPIILWCNASSEYRPPLDIDWFKDGIKLKSDTTREILITKPKERELKTFYSKLEIEKSRMDDAGNYICRSSDLLVASTHVTVLNTDRISMKRETSAGTSSQGGYSLTKSTRSESEKLVHILFIISVLIIYKVRWYS